MTLTCSPLSYRAPSLERLQDDLRIDEDRAEAIRTAWLTPGLPRLDRLARIDVILETHGVERLGRRKRDHLPVDYCNAGDSYTTTLIASGFTLRIGCWADYAEAANPSVRIYNPVTGENC